MKEREREGMKERERGRAREARSDGEKGRNENKITEEVTQHESTIFTLPVTAVGITALFSTNSFRSSTCM